MVEVPDSTTRYIQNDTGKPTKDLFNWMKSISSSLASLVVAEAAEESAWTAYTPTITANTGTFTSVSAAGRYKQIGKTVFVTIGITVTTNGTAASTINATLPVQSQGLVNIGGLETSVTGKRVSGFASSSGITIFIQNYDASYPGANGAAFILSGNYEAI